MNISEILKSVEDNQYSAFFYSPIIYNDEKSYWFKKPEEILSINDDLKIKKFFSNIEKFKKLGLIGYGMIPYEAGYLFEKVLTKKLNDLHIQSIKDNLLFCFFKKNNVEIFNHNCINVDYDSFNNYKIFDFHFKISNEKYFNNIKKIKTNIKNGNTYQVNYTINANFKIDGKLADLFYKMMFNQSAKYSAFINKKKSYIISLSPELFFKIDGNKIETSPMKGTIKRGINFIDDINKKKFLRSNEKDKSENVMIVDLLRNDFGRIGNFNTVNVKKLFDIEKYESVFQMISSISATLKSKINFYDIIKSIFPCGSVTGAPKIKTMEIINELEKAPRKIYTGAIGILSNKKSTFNVAIRTIEINKTNNNGTMGLGSGIVWNSNPKKELSEVKLKGNFLTKSDNYFEIIESMLIENGEIFLFDLHLKRLKSTAYYFLFHFNEKKIIIEINSTINKVDKSKKYKLKINLNKWGNVKSEIVEIIPYPNFIKAIISSKKISLDNKFQYFKTTNRKIYDMEFCKYLKNGFYEVLFFNKKNELAEGSFTNIFIYKNNNIFTPSISSGILDGIYRQFFISKNYSVLEKKIFIDDLLSADKIILTNSVRKEIKLNRLYLGENEFKEFSN